MQGGLDSLDPINIQVLVLKGKIMHTLRYKEKRDHAHIRNFHAKISWACKNTEKREKNTNIVKFLL